MYEKIYENEVRASEQSFDLPQWIACAPFEEYLGMKIESATDGSAVLSMPFKVKHTQGKGLMHGGAVISLADTAVAIAIKSLLPEGTHFVTTEMSLKFLAAVKEGGVRAEASVVMLDERNLEGNAAVFNGSVQVASFKSLFRILRPRHL